MFVAIPKSRQKFPGIQKYIEEDFVFDSRRNETQLFFSYDTEYVYSNENSNF